MYTHIYIFFAPTIIITGKVAHHHQHDVRSGASVAAAAAAYPDVRPNDYLGYCDPAAVNLWRMVVPRGGGGGPENPMPQHHQSHHQLPPPPSTNMTAVSAAETPHWGGYGPWGSMPAPPPGRNHGQQGTKRSHHFAESDDCDDAFSEESGKDQ